MSIGPQIPPGNGLEDCILIAGPTAVGKSDLAMGIAERIGGEIISVDSMQVYRGLDVGTAKPDAVARQRVNHHLIDVADLNEDFDAARFVNLAHAAIADIRARGKRPIFCGGTGLYFKALIDGIGEAPPTDPAMRAALEAAPLAQLLDELERKDPALFVSIDRQNRRRIIRALAVIRLTGRPYSEQRARWGGTRPNEMSTQETRTNCGAVFLALARESEDLHHRIDQRVDRMFAQGLVAETQRLLGQGLEQNLIAMQAIGYRQVVEHLIGKRSLVETVTLIKQRTRHFARRQKTWFRRQLRVEWIHLDASCDLARLTENLCATRLGR